MSRGFFSAISAVTLVTGSPSTMQEQPYTTSGKVMTNKTNPLSTDLSSKRL